MSAQVHMWNSKCLEISHSSCATRTLQWHFLLFLSLSTKILHFSTRKGYKKIVTHYWFLKSSNSIEGAEIFFIKIQFIIVFCHWKIFPEMDIRATRLWELIPNVDNRILHIMPKKIAIYMMKEDSKIGPYWRTYS